MADPRFSFGGTGWRRRRRRGVGFAERVSPPQRGRVWGRDSAPPQSFDFFAFCVHSDT